jgi:hypothetical protein
MQLKANSGERTLKFIPQGFEIVGKLHNHNL